MKSLNIKAISLFIIFICYLNGHALGVTLEDIGLSSATEAQFVKDTEQAFKAAQTIIGYDRAAANLHRYDVSTFGLVRYAIDFEIRLWGYIHAINLLANKDTELTNLSTNLYNLALKRDQMYKDAWDDYYKLYGEQNSDLKAANDEMIKQNEIIKNYEDKYNKLPNFNVKVQQKNL